MDEVFGFNQGTLVQSINRQAAFRDYRIGLRGDGHGPRRDAGASS